MRVIILAAGYDTRLYPLTENFPKALLPVGGRLSLEWLVESLQGIGDVEEILIVTNGIFEDHFCRWLEHSVKAGNLPIRIISDGTRTESEKLGAIGDLAFALKSQGVADDVVFAAGDQLFGSPLAGFGALARSSRSPVIGVFDVGSPAATKEYS